MNLDAITTADQMLAAIESRSVLRIYNGRPGCACGCLGKYNDAPTAADVKRAVAAVRRLASWDHDLCCSDGKIAFVSIQNDRRVWTLYLSPVAPAIEPAV